MPELFRFFGFVFYFYSKEHEPIHVHVAGNDGFAKFAYDEETKTFSLSESKNIKTLDMKKIRTVIDDNTDIIVNA
jgi:hypothetical protein